MIRLAVVAIIASIGLSLAACSKKQDGNASDECAAAVDHMMNVQLADLSKDLDAKSKEAATTAINTAKANLAASCRQMKWSRDAIDCVKAVKTDADAARCDEKLTKEQREAAEKVTDLDPGAATPVEKAPAPASGSSAGSAAGSAAGSGSGGAM